MDINILQDTTRKIACCDAQNVPQKAQKAPQKSICGAFAAQVLCASKVAVTKENDTSFKCVASICGSISDTY